ncbi:TolC family protein [Qipengyuania sp. 1NDH17]|uniref:TolC family protein n=1 Tax=Qipengyuania polymorpha TaxID=2867234 RepID=A0ABS7J0E9_9SPHN|nr:TolC family protein [Qipengyuania polymorpha]MBX7459193.1 TolC family protein [Qipengyuania polymorpha]
MKSLASGCAFALGAVLAAVGAQQACAQETGQAAALQSGEDPALPQPETKPLAIDFANDPVLTLGDAKADPETFRTIVVSALEQSPTDRESAALENAAEARVGEARAGYLPAIDVGYSAYTTLERNFSNDPFNLIERSRPQSRVDFTFSIAQPLIDFGRTQGRVRSAAARLEAAGFEREARAGNVAGDMVIAWTQVFGFQALERLLEGFVEAQDTLDAGIETRIERGVSAEGDRVRVASLRSQAEVELANVRRQLASAEARFEELSGFAPPDRLLRPPLLGDTRFSRDYAILAAQNAPQVKSAEAIAEARDGEVMAAEAEKLPQITGRIDHGRYGIYEDGRNDYDTRATLNFNWRILGGGVWSRSRAAWAEAEAADAVADRLREEARRDAAIAWSDVQAIEEQVRALEEAYKAARQSRDIVFARFGALRGSLFDVADAQNAYLRAASSYIRALTELDQARYVLLLRTGRLLDVLEIEEEEVPL